MNVMSISVKNPKNTLFNVKLEIENIKNIIKDSKGNGYNIIFNDGRSIFITKRRTIIALLILIKYGIGSEADIAKGDNKIPEIKRILKGKISEDFIQDYYGDANKPFSELWNEEGFSFIKNPAGKRVGRSQSYVLDVADHYKLFEVSKNEKAYRKQPTGKQKEEIRKNQKNKCNICGITTKKLFEIDAHTFEKDRRIERFDHRIPIEKGGKNDFDNFQLLCFYCNKSKWQICNICKENKCSECVLAYPEKNKKIIATNEDITDIIKN